MIIGAGYAALITGAGSGIGRALALALAEKGASVSIVDFDSGNGLETLNLVKEVHSRLGISGTAAIFVQCDVTKPEELSLAFAKHNSAFGRLDVCINSAGIGGNSDFINDDKGTWRRVIDVNFVAIVECTRQAVKAMRARGQPGVIINLASAAGLYPAPLMPIYSGSKGGVVLFTRSLSRLRREKIRVNALCPEFIETPMAKSLDRKIIDITGGYLSMDKLIHGAFQLIEDDSKGGVCLWITNRRGPEYWPSEEEENKFLVHGRRKRIPQESKGLPSPNLPTSFDQLMVHKLSSNFRVATKIVTVPLRLPVREGHVLIKNYYAGVNASDVNYSSGRYFANEKEALSRLPFVAGFESVGVVAGIGPGVALDEIALGSAVATFSYGGFTEYSQVPAKSVIPVPSPTPEVVAILVSGLTASLGLQEAGKMRSGETVLVTAAAGGTGQFAVQLAKLAGNKVIGTCGGSDKAALLSSLGVDRVIDYKAEDIKTVLKKEYPRGVDLVYESVGGTMFDTCLNALATFGRLIVIGMISQYQGEGGWQPRNYPGLCEKLLWKSQTIVGFYLMHHNKLWKEHVAKLHSLHSRGKLKIAVDPTPFTGLSSACDAVEYLHSGKSVGKVIIRISMDAPALQISRL
ncbi:hypothetical protein SELMODRAFT_179322 [Selaginella moellendorffii]|uniref:Enoyl reductase (ER) domain-containing protein n=1 Tax=Selaginella moellendorffii TaxID=88036 RepID=D8SFF1_SELML|nr:prostaglandin reductase-3 isoform X1 [Selaginella moellendorffii]EFJ16715.1 hypothetical protein SELMODRAFT_179322 [Selaginella moellendorffii]|eukprot:XP_002982047.1 prostaglandin reductase-3 isoform X1 [Selaginella moellendorffii]